MLRLHLPPNLAAAAPRNAIALKVEFDPTATPDPELWPALALLQRWCNTPTPPRFLQLTRAQLRELASALETKPVFVENGRTVAWHYEDLVAEPAGESVGDTRARTDGSMPNAAQLDPRTRASRSRAAAPAPAPPMIDGSEHFLAITLPSREHPAYTALLELLKSAGFTLEPSNRKWWLRDRHRTLNFLAEHGPRLRAEFGAESTPNFDRNTARIRSAEIVCQATESGDDFEITLALRAGTGGDDAVRSAVASHRGYVESGGSIYLLEAAKLRQLDAAQHALAGSPDGGVITRRTHRVGAARAAEAEEILGSLSPDFQPPAAWRARSEALRNLSRLESAPIPVALETVLRPYQRLGTAWLWHLHRHQLGGILADEMGLGKTLQALALLCAITGRGAPAAGSPALTRTSLVVCPASLLENWRREAARFAPDLRVFVHHGANRLTTTADAARFDLVVTSYGTLSRDWELFSAVTFGCVIADEAQHIKNRRSQNAAALRSLRAHSRFLLTGTPLENSFADLRSLFEFLLPGYVEPLPSGLSSDERTWYDDRLRAQAAPYILRRTKRAVAPELPARLEQTIWCELSEAQAALYRETQQRTERELFDLEANGASEGQIRFAALTQLLRLRQICCDPRLVRAGSGAGAELADDVASAAVDDSANAPVSNPAAQSAANAAAISQESAASDGGAVGAPYPDSAKLDAFRELLAEAVDDGHRLLVFSQFTSLLALLREELRSQSVPYCYLDGSMSTRARQSEVDRFQASAEVPVFLISLKAGGTGLNLTGADTVVHFDPWWNPAAEAQATDRAHRIGQARVVTSYKLIASGTVEEKVLALQEGKRALLAGVFEASDAVAAQLSLTDLRSLLT